MSGNNQDYDNQNDDDQNYDDENQDSQDDNSQNNDVDGDDCDNDENNEDDNDDDDNDDEEEGDDNNSDGPKYIRLRGLPWSATHKEILDFLKNVNVIGGAEGIHLITSRWDGKNTGEAYVEVKSKQDVKSAMKLDNASMGHRYIEVFSAAPREAREAMRKTSGHGNSYVVKLRGLPYSVTEQQVEEFFNGLEIKPDREGIIFVMDRRGRATGEAFVQFESQEDTEQALGRNREKIGHRYIEIFRSSLAELRRSTNGSGRVVPYDLKDRGSNRGGNDYGNNNNRQNRWGGNNGGFGVGANNTLGFNNLPNFGNSGNFGSNNAGGGGFGNFGNNCAGGGVGGMGNFSNFGNNGAGGGSFGSFGNNNGGNYGNNSLGNNSVGGGFNRFSGNSGNFGNDFGDFGNFGNDRGNNGVGGGMGGSMGGNGMGGNSMGGGNNNSGGGFNNFSSFGNNMGGGFGSNMGGGGFGANMSGISGGVSGGNFGPIGGSRNDDYYVILMRGLPFTSFEKDVFKFFDPIRPANVRVHYQKKNGRHNGTAEALFESYEDAQLAMKRHRCKMGQRYIELFFNGKSNKPKIGNNYISGNSIRGGSVGSANSIGVGGGMGGSIGFSRRI